MNKSAVETEGLGVDASISSLWGYRSPKTRTLNLENQGVLRVQNMLRWGRVRKDNIGFKKLTNFYVEKRQCLFSKWFQREGIIGQSLLYKRKN